MSETAVPGIHSRRGDEEARDGRSSPLTQLSEQTRALALERLQVLTPHLHGEVPLARLVREHGIALRTAQRWVAGYRRHGLAGLVRGSRNDRGRHRLPPEVQLLIEGLALRVPRPSITAITRQVGSIARNHEWQPSSYGTVCAVVRHLDPALVTLARQGPKAYRARFDMIYRREAARPNETWQADHTLLDIWVLDQRGRPARPWLTAVIDDYSRAVAGFRVEFEAPNTLGTALMLRQAIWREADPRWHVYGIPTTFYADHGSDFTSRHLEQAAADLKIRLVFSLPGQPRGRGRIERFFGTVNQLFLRNYLKGDPCVVSLRVKHPPPTVACAKPTNLRSWRTIRRAMVTAQFTVPDL